MKRSVSILALLLILLVAPEAKAGVWWEAGSLFHQWAEYLKWFLG